MKNLLRNADLPREKLSSKGAKNLNTNELLALIIRSGTRDLNALELSSKILNLFNNDLEAIHRKSVLELTKIEGVGEAKAAGIIAALELAHRKNKIRNINKAIKSSEDAFAWFNEQLGGLNHEEFWVMMLNRANRVIKMDQISKGGLHGTIVDPKVVFKSALDNRACGIILGHNHPSGNTEPSRQDKDLTDKIISGAKLIDISVFDHIIVGDQTYYSFADNNLI